jgi:hypothetical protein
MKIYILSLIISINNYISPKCEKWTLKTIDNLNAIFIGTYAKFPGNGKEDLIL